VPKNLGGWDGGELVRERVGAGGAKSVGWGWWRWRGGRMAE